MMATALDGITVLDLSSGAAAALATMFLSDQGARVVRVVEPGTPALRDGGYVIWDRAKECVALDLDAAVEPASKAAADFRRLVEGADVLIEDFAPSSPLQKMVDATGLKAINPRLVSCSITAYGKSGPMRHEPPIDELVLAYTGVLSGMP